MTDYRDLVLGDLLFHTEADDFHVCDIGEVFAMRFAEQGHRQI